MLRLHAQRICSCLQIVEIEPKWNVKTVEGLTKLVNISRNRTKVEC